VRLSGEDLRFGPDGRLGAGGEKPNKASELFTASFTQRYGEIARRSPVYAQLRNLIDLLVAAAFIRQQDYYGRANWTLATLGREDAFPVQQAAAPQQVDCVVQAYWKGNRLLAPAGGGVSILAHEALAPQYVRSDDDGHLAAGRQRAAPVREDRWWWD
jgi:hypothetical protein